MSSASSVMNLRFQNLRSPSDNLRLQMANHKRDVKISTNLFDMVLNVFGG